MAPMKRPAAASKKVAMKVRSTSSGPAAKKGRGGGGAVSAPAKGPASARAVASIASGLEQATCVPDEVRRMVEATFEAAVSTYADERHEFQTAVVRMVERVLVDTEAQFVAEVTEKEAASAAAQDAVAGQEAACSVAEGELKARQEVKTACNLAEREQEKELKDKIKAEKAAAKAEKDWGKDVAAARASKESVATAIEQYARPLVAGVEADKVKGLMDPLLRTMKGFEGLDESVLVALPDALGKGPDARGAFDKLLVDKALEELEKRLGVLTEESGKLENGEGERKAASTAAREAVEAATKQRDERAEAAVQAQQTLEAATASLEANRKSLAGPLAKEVKVTAKEAGAAAKKLDAFRSGPLAAFRAVQSATRPVEPAAPAVEEPAAEGEAAPAEAVATPAAEGQAA